MKKFTLLQILLLFLLINSAYAQQTEPKDDDVVKVTTSLVQVDAVVTDKNGNPVTNLTAADFEILQDGKSQTITNLSFISREMTKEISSQTLVTKKPDKNAPAPPVSTGSTKFGRILTFVVDDGGCESTPSGMLSVQRGLEKFINEQMLPSDSVAIYQTRAGSSLLQQYTSDKALLLRTIRKIRWYPPNGLCEDVTGNDYPAIENKETSKGTKFEGPQDAERREAIVNAQRDRQAAGLVGVTTYAIKGLQRVGGRKILFVMSDSLAIMTDPPNSLNGKRNLPNAIAAVRELTDIANRASVVINTIDNRGLIIQTIEARDDASGAGKIDGMLNTGPLIAKRISSDENRQSGLSYVATETGGTFYRNMINLDVPIRNALKAENGYYLIGYQPDDEVFKGKSFHKIEIKLKRSDLAVNSRAGFYGVTDDARRPKPRTGDSELYEALTAPLPNADMNLKLSAYFVNTPNKGNFIHALLYIDGRDITFTDGANGNKKAVFDIVAVTLNEKNEIIDDSNSTRTVQIPADKIASIRRDGLIYVVDVPIKKEGVYTFRTALREINSKRLGSSSQFIEIPNLKKDKVYLSGLIISGVDKDGKFLVAEAKDGENAFSTVISKSIPAIRQFRRNSIVGYAYTIYNAKIDPAANQPNLVIQTNLYHDGKILSEGVPQPAKIEKQPDMTRINDYAYLQLNPNVPPGDYALQVIVKDVQTNQTTSQWVDFEIIE